MARAHQRHAAPLLGLRAPPKYVSRVAVVRLTAPDWIVVIFRGTTPSPLRGLLREGQINSAAGQEEWRQSPGALEGARVHRGYAEWGEGLTDDPTLESGPLSHI